MHAYHTQERTETEEKVLNSLLEITRTPTTPQVRETVKSKNPLTISLPESEDTEEAEEPEDSSWGLDRDRVRRWL